MRITILCVGRIKEAFFRDACSEYIKRLGKYAKLDIIEVADEKTPDKASASEEEAIKKKEGERLLARMDPGARTIALAIKGKRFDSESFAAELDKTATYGMSHIQFVIGGSLGLSDEILSAADMKLSFSDMTFPHQLMRVILLEQIYRAFRIIKGEPYHK